VSDEHLNESRRALLGQAALAMVLFAVLGVSLGWHFQPPLEKPRPARINVRWSAGISEADRRDAETALRLTERVQSDVSTWQYSITDVSPVAIATLLRHPAVEDTHGIDRSTMSLNADAFEASTATPPNAAARWALGVDRARGQPLTYFLCFALLWCLMALPVARWAGDAIATRLISPLHPGGVRAYRTVLGAGMAIAVSMTWILPDQAVPLAVQRDVDWFAAWTLPKALAERPDLVLALRSVVVAAFVTFAAGIRPRLAWIVAVAVLVLLIMVKLRVYSSHDWSVPLVTVLALTTVRWDRGDRMSPADRGFALWLPGAMVGLAFAAAGIAKLRTSGFDWITTGAVRYHFVQDAPGRLSDVGLWIASHETAAIVVSTVAIAIELGLVIVASSPKVLWRLVALALALGILIGFKMMQGVFWPAWWVLLISFLPWNAMTNRFSIADVSREATNCRLRPAQARVLTGLLLTQIAATIMAKEYEPFISNFPMYAETYASPEAFNAIYRADHQTMRSWRVQPTGCMRAEAGMVAGRNAALEVMAIEFNFRSGRFESKTSWFVDNGNGWVAFDPPPVCPSP
jgi:hypothetical protein